MIEIDDAVFFPSENERFSDPWVVQVLVGIGIGDGVGVNGLRFGNFISGTELQSGVFGIAIDLRFTSDGLHHGNHIDTEIGRGWGIEDSEGAFLLQNVFVRSGAGPIDGGGEGCLAVLLGLGKELRLHLVAAFHVPAIHGHAVGGNFHPSEKQSPVVGELPAGSFRDRRRALGIEDMEVGFIGLGSAFLRGRIVRIHPAGNRLAIADDVQMVVGSVFEGESASSGISQSLARENGKKKDGGAKRSHAKVMAVSSHRVKRMTAYGAANEANGMMVLLG